jgi:predicted dehydrogenase
MNIIIHSELIIQKQPEGNNMEKLKIAIIGTGKVTQSNYLPTLSAEPDVSLGYYNRSPEKANVCADKFGGKVYQSIAEIMDWRPDTVMILTREMDRYGAAKEILNQSPRRIFFEKPLVAMSSQENVTEDDFTRGKEILNKAKSIHCETAMVFNYRFFEHSLKAKKIVSERDFGKPLNVAGFVHYACWSHAIDLIHHFAGPISEICSLRGKTIYSTPDGGGMSAADVSAAFRTDSDATGTLIGTTNMAWQFPLFELTFNYERGRIRLQDLDGEMVVMDYSGREVETSHFAGHTSRWNYYDDSFDKSIKAYLKSVRDNSQPPVPGISGLMELQVEAALKRSIAQSRPVNLPLEFPITLE